MLSGCSQLWGISVFYPPVDPLGLVVEYIFAEQFEVQVNSLCGEQHRRKAFTKISLRKGYHLIINLHKTHAY